VESQRAGCSLKGDRDVEVCIEPMVSSGGGSC
jgi:hypothetical protein